MIRERSFMIKVDFIHELATLSHVFLGECNG